MYIILTCDDNDHSLIFMPSEFMNMYAYFLLCIQPSMITIGYA